MSTDAAARDARPRAGLGRSTAIFAVWTGLSRVIGLVREIIVAAMFGVSGSIAAFAIAFNIPNVIRSLVADSALSAALIPVYTEMVEGGRRRDAQRLVGAVAGLVSLILGALALAAIVAAPWVMPLFAPGLSSDLQDETVRLSQLMFPIVPLLGLTGVVSAVLQANGEFGATGFVPILWNGIIIAFLGYAAFALPDDDRITVYAIAIVVGTLGQLVLLTPFLARVERLRLSIGYRMPEIRRVLVLMLPVSLGLGMINVNAAIDNVFATLVSEEAVRAIDAAFRLYILPQGIFSVAISTVLFPTIARMVARRDSVGVREAVASGVRQIVFLLVPASLFLVVLAEPITRLTFQRGNFDAAATDLTSKALVTFTIGLVFNGASLLLLRTFYSLQMPWLTTKVAALGFVVNIVLDAIFYQPFGVSGIPLATSIASMVTFAVLMVLLRREIGGLGTRSLVDGFVRCLAAAGVMAVLAWSTWTVLDSALGRSTIAQIACMTMALAAGLAAYLSAALAFELPELGKLSSLIRPLR